MYLLSQGILITVSVCFGEKSFFSPDLGSMQGLILRFVCSGCVGKAMKKTVSIQNKKSVLSASWVNFGGAMAGPPNTSNERNPHPPIVQKGPI